MSKLLEFFKSKNLERKFSRLGDGHRLRDDVSSEAPPVVSTPTQQPVRKPAPSTTQSNKAADAALERLNQKNKKPSSAARNEVLREIERARKVDKEAEELRERFTQKVVSVDKPSALTSVRFWCPNLFGMAVLGSREEIDQKIDAYLLGEAATDLPEAATLRLIRGLENSRGPPVSPDVPLAEQPTQSEWRERRRQQFARILTNLIQSPENATYRRLRIGNQLVTGLLSIDGAELFFEACHFTRELQSPTAPKPLQQEQQSVSPSLPEALPIEADTSPPAPVATVATEPFLVITEENARDADHLQRMLDLITSANPIMPELYQDTKVFQATGTTSGMLSRDHLPDEYFIQTRDELRRSLEQQQRIIEESGMLMTKAMRERLRNQEVRTFRYSLVRVRLPGNLILQGTFHASDTLGKVRGWITDSLTTPSTVYQLWAPPGTVPVSRSGSGPTPPPTVRTELTDDQATIGELGLAPCSLINLSVVGTSTTTATSAPLLRADVLSTAVPL